MTLVVKFKVGMMEKLDYKVGGKVGSRYVISLNKYFKVEFNVMIDDIVD